MTETIALVKFFIVVFCISGIVTFGMIMVLTLRLYDVNRRLHILEKKSGEEGDQRNDRGRTDGSY